LTRTPAKSQRKKKYPTIAATHCEMTNAGAERGAIPEKLSVSERAMVTAGFAKEVEAVNQYAAAM
jgi:hypothetical protein